MIKYIKYWTYVPTMLAAVNVALIAFHTYHFDNPQLQALNVIVSVVGTIIGVHVNNTDTKNVE